MPDKKSSPRGKLRPVSGSIITADVASAMNSLLQRVRVNKSKRSSVDLAKAGPLRVSLVGMDEAGKLEEKASTGAFSIQCLFGHVTVTVDGGENPMTTGDLLVVASGAPYEVSAVDPSVLLVTAFAEE